MEETALSRNDPERFDPARDADSLVGAEHLARYVWAAQLVAGRRVLDAGCGTGYGTAILAEHDADEVTGADISPRAVEQAAVALGPRGHVVEADLRRLPFEDASFDIVTCFEVIEHVVEQDAVLAELTRVLAPDGVLAISSPNRGVYAPGNPHHVHEYTADEFEDALRARFSHVAMLRQFPWLGTSVTTADAVCAPGTLDGVTVRHVTAHEAGQETYTLALASAVPLPPPRAGVVVLASDFDVRWWRAKVTEGEEVVLHMRHAEENQRRAYDQSLMELEEVRARAAELSRHLLRSEAMGAELLDLRRRFQEVVDERHSYEGEVIAALADKDERIALVESHLSELTGSSSWRLTRPLRALKRAARRIGV